MAHKARKRFGQHFLTDTNVLSRISDEIDRRSEGCGVIEIGPGLGALTEFLLTNTQTAAAIELDRDLVAHLREKYCRDQINIIAADVLAVDFQQLKQELGSENLLVCGNLPYNISTPLLFHLLDHIDAIKHMVFMVQKEVADRLTASTGSKQWGRLSVMSQRILDCQQLFDVPPDAFNPPPKVISTVVHLTPKTKTQPLEDYSCLQEVVKQAFSQRRKTIRNSLKALFQNEDFESCGVDATDRPENIGVAEFVRMSNHLARSRQAHS
ncbi:MAG: 16S rRNA (adenine(1518)-N(6)/adenine(1519)-N(6))-dimethyltransferase RsmA [Pseudomonadota bacterium]